MTDFIVAQPPSPVKVGPAKKRRMTLVNWSECIVCQLPKNEALRSTSETALNSLVSAAQERQDEVYDRLQSEENSLQDKIIVWHRCCFQIYTSKTNIACIANKNANCVLESASTTLSGDTEFNPSLCMFCQKLNCNQERSLHQILPDSGMHTIRKAVEEKGDEILKSRLDTIEVRSVGL